MFSIKSLVQAVRSWRRRGGGPKTPHARRNAVRALERLDHRQLLSANFTGNAITDIPAKGPAGTGTVILQDNGTVRHPGIPGDLKPIIKVSGLDLSGIRLQYSPTDDILSVALQQPDNQKTGQPVLAGDTDNNGDGGTVDPAVQALRPDFIDFAFLGGSESMGAFLDLNGDAIPDVVAGISGNPNQGKLYQVANAVVNPDPTLAAKTIPGFGTKLLNNTGASFLANDPANPSFEFQVTNFSKLYQDKTGQPLATSTTIGVGAFGTSDQDDGISEAFFPAQNANFGVVPTPVVCPPPPVVPINPPITINPHENRHVNTAHPTDVRVTIFGTRTLDVNQINVGSLRLGGAAPIASFERNVNRDGMLDLTVVFRGSDITLPRGFTTATLTGALNDGTPISSHQRIFNRNDSYYTQAEIAARDARQAREGFNAANPPKTPFQKGQAGNLHDLAILQSQEEQAASFSATERPTVKIPTRAAVASPSQGAMVSAASHSGGRAAAQSPLLVSIPKRPVTQADPPVTVKIPTRSSVTVPNATARPAARTRPLAGVPGRAGLARAARATA